MLKSSSVSYGYRKVPRTNTEVTTPCQECIHTWRYHNGMRLRAYLQHSGFRQEMLKQDFRAQFVIDCYDRNWGIASQIRIRATRLKQNAIFVIVSRIQDLPHCRTFLSKVAWHCSSRVDQNSGNGGKSPRLFAHQRPYQR